VIERADDETRSRILKVAKELFGDHGFKHVTVRRICEAAGANVASVNYYFKDKLGLYREVMQSAIDVMNATTDDARRAGEGQAPEEQLRIYLRIFLPRILGNRSDSIHRLITREVNDPTSALDDLIERGLRPRIDYVSGVVARILNLEKRDPRVLRCVASVQSQVMSYVRNPVAERMGFAFRGTEAEIEEIVRHIVAFSLGGVHAIGEDARKTAN
jgi:TetR/AcrR family transcriptional regulator, regulator of cefoperazone and chloramphenicol sensitivity